MAEPELQDMANAAIEAADEEVSQAVKDEMRGNATMLKANAISFLTKTQDIYERILNVNRVQSIEHRLKETLKSENVDQSKANTLTMELAELTRSTVQASEFTTFMTEVFKFQNDVNLYLGQEVKTVYVFVGRDGNPILFELDHSGENVIMGMASKGRGISARYRNVTKKRMEGLKRIDDLERKFNLIGLKSAYTETLARGKYSKTKGFKGGLRIFWKPDAGGPWKKMIISSAGDVNEAYAAFYLANEPKPSFSSGNIEILLDEFLLDSTRGVAAVDNISGLLEGDVTVGNVEYAIKSGGASALSYTQVVDLAMALRDMSPEEIANNYVEDYKQKLHNKGVTRNKLELILEKIVDDDLIDFKGAYLKQ